MALDNRTVVLRILDDQNRLVDRADSKAISLLGTLGVFTVFFVSHFNDIPIHTLTIILLAVYFVSILLSVMYIITAISPRIRSSIKGQKQNMDEKTAYQPTFFAGICEFPSLADYKNCLEEMVQNDQSLTNSYVQQVYAVAKIADIKYKSVRRAVVFVVLTLSTQVILIAHAFASKIIAQ